MRRTGPGSYDVVAKPAKSTPSRSVEEDSEDPELESLLCSQLALAVSSEEALVRKRKRDSSTQRELLAVAGRDDKRPRSCTSSTQERQHDSGHVGDPTTQRQPPTREATLEDDASLELGKARSTGRSSTQPAVVDEDEPTQADIDSVCEIAPTQTRKSDRRRVLTKRACEAPKQTVSRVTGGTSLAFALQFIFGVLTVRESL